MDDNDPGAEIDYAYLAAWARVNGDGTLTAVDASFLKAAAPLGSAVGFAVAARVRFTGGHTVATVKIAVRPPGQQPSMEYVASLDATGAEEYADGRRHMLLALNTAVAVPEYGNVTVDIYLDDDLCRTLVFEAIAPPSAA